MLLTLKTVQIGLKYALDFIFSLIGIVLLAPIFVLISLAIKFDDGGPVLFVQNRLGKHGNVFKIIKFRTMIINADEFLNEAGESSVDRITRVGRYLRKYSLDELPQFFNILLAQMSFIGPRPTLVEHWGRYTEEQKRRFSMRPGITGWAQVSGRNEIPWSKRIEHDLHYIDNYSLLFDLKIFLLTLHMVVTGKGMSMDRNASVADDLSKTDSSPKN